LSFTLALTGPQGAAIGIAQIERLAGGVVGNLTGLELAVGSVKTEDRHSITGGESDLLLAGKPGPPQPQIELTPFAGVNRQGLLAVKCHYRTIEGNPGMLNGCALALPLTLAATITLSLATLVPLSLTLPLPLTLSLATLTLRLAVVPLGQAETAGSSR
jgi:hypothetical protein